MESYKLNSYLKSIIDYNNNLNNLGNLTNLSGNPLSEEELASLKYYNSGYYGIFLPPNALPISTNPAVASAAAAALANPTLFHFPVPVPVPVPASQFPLARIIPPTSNISSLSPSMLASDFSSVIPSTSTGSSADNSSNVSGSTSSSASIPSSNSIPSSPPAKKLKTGKEDEGLLSAACALVNFSRGMKPEDEKSELDSSTHISDSTAPSPSSTNASTQSSEKILNNIQEPVKTSQSSITIASNPSPTNVSPPTQSPSINIKSKSTPRDLKKCQFEGCTKYSQGSTKFCIGHGGGRRCTFKDCTKGARDKLFCAAHGGGRRCSLLNCKKSAVGSSSLCTLHGGGRRCSYLNCLKSSQSNTNYCVKHGGGKLCSVINCNKVSRGKTNFCASHGGGVRCVYTNCKKLSVTSLQMCRSHSLLVKGNQASSTTTSSTNEEITPGNKRDAEGNSKESEKVSSLSNYDATFLSNQFPPFNSNSSENSYCYSCKI